MTTGYLLAPTWEDVLPTFFLWDGYLFSRRPSAKLAWHYSCPQYLTPQTPQGLGVTVAVTPEDQPSRANAETAIIAAKQHLDYWKLSATRRAAPA